MGSMWSSEGEYLSNSPEFASKKKKAKRNANLSVAQASKLEIQQWAKKNPENAAYDNDGNPIEKDK